MNPTSPPAPSTLRAAAAVCGLALALSLGPVQAQNAAGKPAAAKPATARPAAKAPAPKLPPPLPPLPDAPGEQIAAASMTHFGNYDCDFSQIVEVGLNAKNEGYIDVRLGKQAWIMKPVLSSTGALRLEDVRGRMLMLQIANKSMLMDAVAGQRIVDNCVHEKQRESARSAAAADAARAAGAAPPAGALIAATPAAAAAAAAAVAAVPAAAAVEPAAAASAPR